MEGAIIAVVRKEIGFIVLGQAIPWNARSQASLQKVLPVAGH